MNSPQDENENQSDSGQTVTVKVSRLALTAIICAIIGILFLPYIFENSTPEGIENYHPGSEMLLQIAGGSSLAMLVTSVVLGIVSYIQIEKRGGKRTGRSFAVGAVILPILPAFVVVLLLSVHNARRIAPRMICGTNLAGIGKAMLLYAKDYDDQLPRTGGSQTVWVSRLPDWKASNRAKAFGLENGAGQATISSSLYLLVKYAEVTPKSFLCWGDHKIKKFLPSEYNAADNELLALWDFGPEPWKHCSYSYQIPYSSYTLTTSGNPRVAVAGDRNPWIPSLGWKTKDFNGFNPDGDRDAIKVGNSHPHADEGQNVVYLDSHVEFKNDPFCGVNGDNIYTSWNGDDIRRGTTPTLGSRPVDKMDSLLVNDPPIKKP